MEIAQFVQLPKKVARLGNGTVTIKREKKVGDESTPLRVSIEVSCDRGSTSRPWIEDSSLDDSKLADFMGQVQKWIRSIAGMDAFSPSAMEITLFPGVKFILKHPDTEEASVELLFIFEEKKNNFVLDFGAHRAVDILPFVTNIFHAIRVRNSRDL